MTKQVALTLTPSDLVKIKYALIGYATLKTDGAKAYPDVPRLKESYTRQANEAIDLLERIEAAYLAA